MRSTKRVLRLWTPWILAAIGILVILATFLVAFWMIPEWQLRAYGGTTGSLTRAEYVAATNSLRSAYAAALSGIGGVAILMGLLVSWRQANEARRATEETVHNARLGRIAELFSRAIDQLGKPERQVVLGGIYSLERIAAEAKISYRDPVVEILTAYIRDKYPANHGATQPLQAPKDPPKPEVDLEAALLAVMRISIADGPDGGLNFANFNEVNIQHGKLNGAHLFGVDMRDSSMEYMGLKDANLGPVDGTTGLDYESRLEGARLIGADLSGTDLTGVHLDDAILHCANMKGTILNRTHLKCARLEGVDLSEALELTQEQIDEAYMDANTKLPRGMRPSNPRKVTALCARVTPPATVLPQP